MNSTNSRQQSEELRTSIHALLKQLEAYRVANPDEFQNLEDWVEASTDLVIIDALDVLLAVSFYLI